MPKKNKKQKIEELEDLVAEIWLYINDTHVVRHLGAEEKDLFADCLDNYHARNVEFDEPTSQYDRWWKQ